MILREPYNNYNISSFYKNDPVSSLLKHSFNWMLLLKEFTNTKYMTANGKQPAHSTINFIINKNNNVN